MSYSKYPGEIDDETTLPVTVDLETEVEAEVVNRLRDSIVATESTIGADPTDGYATVKDRLDAMQTEIDAGSGVAAHASTHEDGGSDEVTIQNLGSGGAVANKVMVTDGAGGLTLEDHGGGGGSFTAGGDLTGDDTEQTVSYLRGIPTPDPADADDAKIAIFSEGAAPTFTNPRSITSDATEVWVAELDVAIVTVFNATSRRFIAQYDYSSLYTPAFGGAIRTVALDSSYAYITTFGDNHVLIVDRTDGSVAGWAYAQVKAVHAVSDGTNLYVIGNDASPPTAPSGIQKFVISGCIGQPRSTKTYDDIVDSTGGLDSEPRRLELGGGYLWACAWQVDVNMVYKIDLTTFAIVASNDADGLVSSGGFDLVYAFGYLWVTTNYNASVVQYDLTTLAALSNTALGSLEDAAGIAIGPDTAGNPNARLWVTDLDPGLSPLPAIYALNPTGPAYDTSVNLGAAYERATDDLTGTSTHMWIPTFDWANIEGVMVVDPTTGLNDGFLGELTFDYKQPFESLNSGGFVQVGSAGEAEGGFPEARGVENGIHRRATHYTSRIIGSYNWAAKVTAPRGCAYVGHAIWVADNVNHLIHSIDITTVENNRSIGATNFMVSLDISTLTPAGTNPIDLAFDGEYVWTANAGSNNVSRIEENSYGSSLVDSFPPAGLGHTPQRIIYDGVYMFVCGGTTLSRLTSTGVHSTLAGFTNLTDMIFDGRYVWAVDAGTNQLRKIDGETMTLVTSVTLTGTATVGNRVAFDGAHVYATRYVPTNPSGTRHFVEAIHVDTHESTIITLSEFEYLSVPADITFDGTMIVLIGYHATFHALRHTYIDPTTKREIGTPLGGMSLGGTDYNKAYAIGPGFIVAFDGEKTASTTVTYFMSSDPLMGAGAQYGRTTKLQATPKTGIAALSIASQSGIIALSPSSVNSAVVELRGDPSGNITLQYLGGGPGPFIVHNRASDFGAFTLTVDLGAGATPLVLNPTPGEGESAMFYWWSSGGAGQVVQMKFV